MSNDDSLKDLKPEDIKDGKFIDKDGTEQIAVPLSSIFKMVGGKSKVQAKKPPETPPPPIRRPKRGIKK